MPETTNKQASKGPYNWPMTALQRMAYVRCPDGPADSYATRMCSGNYSSGAVWQSVRDAECQYNNKRTEKLGSLSQVACSRCLHMLLRKQHIHLHTKISISIILNCPRTVNNKKCMIFNGLRKILPLANFV